MPARPCEILLIYPKLGFDVQDVSFELPMCYLCIAGPLLKAGFKPVILDQRITDDFDRSLAETLERKPVFAGISVITGMQIIHGLDVARKIRRISPGTPIVFGGVHPTLMPDQTLQNGLIDYIVRGEGEETACELARALQTGDDPDRVDGLSLRREGLVYHAPDRPPIDLDAQPEIPYHLVRVERYLMGMIPGYRRSLDVYTSRGCPCSCTYCYNQSFNKRRWRPIGTDRIIRNMRHLIDTYAIDSVFFNDDNMFVSLPRVYEICEAMISELPYAPAWGSVGSRVDALQGCDYDLLERSGCKHLYIGIETGSARIMNQIKKGITMDQVMEVVRDLSRTNVVPHYNFMTGYPGETAGDLEATLDLIDRILQIHPAAYVSSLHIISPYPGTPFAAQAQEHGWNPPDTLEGWSGIYWEKTNMPWMSAKRKKALSNISIISYFIDHKVADRLQGRPVFLAGVSLYGKLAKWRWKHRFFGFCPEFQMLKRLNEWTILE